MSRKLTTYRNPPITTLIAQAPTIELLLEITASTARLKIDASTRKLWSIAGEKRLQELMAAEPPKFEKVSVGESLGQDLTFKDVELMDAEIVKYQTHFKGGRVKILKPWQIMGARSLLFGVHQFLWHPVTVLLAWIKLYGKPDWKTCVCILIHDWGYWGCWTMDGVDGENHPRWAAELARRWFGQDYHDLLLYHSRHLAAKVGASPSKLCWADKLSMLYDPRWFYLLRARLTGEIREYRANACGAHGRTPWSPLPRNDEEWYDGLREKLIKLAKEQGACLT